MSAVRQIVIVGDGVDGWSAAAAMACAYAGSREITLVPYPVDDLPALVLRQDFRRWIGILGIDEATLLNAAFGTVSLAYSFTGWPGALPDYVLPVGEIGVSIGDIAFHHLWLALRARGAVPPLEAFAIGAVAARAGRFTPPDPDPSSPLSGLDYGYHLDAAGYRAMLRDYALAAGVKVAPATAVAGEGLSRIAAVRLANGDAISGDIFLDCTGHRRLLIGGVLRESFDDWTGLMPSDRALAWMTPGEGTTTLAQTRYLGGDTINSVPMRGRTAHILSCRTAAGPAKVDVPGDAMDIACNAGRLARSWVENCVAIGAAAAVIADYDGAAGALLQKGITQLVQLFPARTDSRIESVEYNRRMRRLQDQFADAVVYRHAMAARAGGAASVVSVSDELKARMTLFERTGRVAPSEDDPIRTSHWAALMLGHQGFPVAFHPFAGAALDPATTAAILSIPERLRSIVAAMPKVIAR